ncbi:MAG: hypothetical protein ACFCVD_01270 [Nodosilinea sp.]
MGLGFALKIDFCRWGCRASGMDDGYEVGGVTADICPPYRCAIAYPDSDIQDADRNVLIMLSSEKQ